MSRKKSKGMNMVEWYKSISKYARSVMRAWKIWKKANMKLLNRQGREGVVENIGKNANVKLHFSGSPCTRNDELIIHSFLDQDFHSLNVTFKAKASPRTQMILISSHNLTHYTLIRSTLPSSAHRGPDLDLRPLSVVISLDGIVHGRLQKSRQGGWMTFYFY